MDHHFVFEERLRATRVVFARFVVRALGLTVASDLAICSPHGRNIDGRDGLPRR